MERCAFTLIEMMIAVALGAMVVYVAAAGFRGASQAVTAANRLALDNAIMRAGVGIALNEKDFWLNVDDPFDLNNAEGRQPLRTGPTAANGTTPPRGLPFTPFANASSEGIYTHTPDTYDSSRPWIPAENASGWNPNAWNANESRGWAWGNLNERIPYIHSKIDLTQTFGRYHQYSRPEVTAVRHWQQRQLEGLKNSLGYYGLFDYLPANTPMMVYERNGSSWSVSREWCFVGSADNRVKDVNYIGNDDRRNGFNFANDLMHASNGNPFIIPNAKPTTGTISQIAYKRYSTGISLSMSSNNSSISNIGNLLNDGMYLIDWLPNRPAHWPSLQVSSLRFVRTSSFVCMNRVIWTSPLTGLPTELNFTAFGTTLRGARQQRHLTQRGWSDPFVANPSDSPNLDTY